MKSNVLIRPHCLIALVFFLTVSISSVRSDNTCPCQNPPGGSVRCEQGQVPFCQIADGHVLAECKTPPRSARTATTFKLWYASQLFEKKLALDDLKRPEVKQALVTGTVRTSSGITTSIPLERVIALIPRQEGSPELY